MENEFERYARRARNAEICMWLTLLVAAAIILQTCSLASAEPGDNNSVRRPLAPKRAPDHSTFSPSVIRSQVIGARPSQCPVRAWCGCWLADRKGLTDKSLWNARRWLHVGRPALPGCVGCIAVLSRGRGGHVGIVQGYEGQNPIILSGNHNNAVGIGTYPASRVIAYREL